MSRSPHRRYDATPSELKERLSAERAGVSHFIYYDGEDRQRIVFLADDRDRVMLGRHADSDISCSWDPYVSRAHACLERVGHGEWVLEDHGLSRHGSFVNGERVRSHHLRDHDVITIGDVHMLYRSQGDPDETPPLVPTVRPELTPRKRSVLIELCRPYRDSPDPHALPTNREIGDALDLDESTVKEHLRGLAKGLGVDSAPPIARRRLLCRRALEQGWISELDL